MSQLLALLDQIRRWLWLIALLVGVTCLVAGAYRVLVSRPRAERQVLEHAGAAAERIRQVDAAAARGDDAEVQRLDAEALARAEELVKACGKRCK